jgi:protein-S-isoprenylcysteine O-methyltransferase Ste14
MARAREVVKTVGTAVVLHAVFTIGLPWLLLTASRSAPWAWVSLGPARWIGPAAIAFGVYLYVWAVVRLLARRTSALPGYAPTVLETDGWYARVRHPLLLGVVCVLLGEAVTAQSLVLLAYALAYWLWLDVFVARYEEPELRAVFGDAYASYCRRVPRWIPRLGGSEHQCGL